MDATNIQSVAHYTKAPEMSTAGSALQSGRIGILDCLIPSQETRWPACRPVSGQSTSANIPT